MVPQAAPEQPVPERVHVTALFVEPVTAAINCCLFPAITCTAGGDTLTTTGGTIVTAAVADFVVSAFEVAFTATSAGLGTTAGAVYKPLDVTVPQRAPLQPVPDTLQVTPLFGFPFTTAVNCCVCPATTWAVVGEIATTVGGTTVTIADADFDGSAFEVAVTVTCGGLGIVVGAVYCPLEEIVPQALPVHEAPIRLHLTLVSVEPVTVAVNCWLVPMTTCAVAGEILTTTAATIVIVADADLVGSAIDFAVRVICAGPGTMAGAE